LLVNFRTPFKCRKSEFTGVLSLFLTSFFCTAPLPALAESVDIRESGAIVETAPADRTSARLFTPPVIQGRPKIGLALGGGGARGAATVGVLKIFDQAGIKFDCVTGTSIGAVIGGFYVLGATPDEMEQEFRNGAVMRSFMTVPLGVRVLASPLFSVLSVFDTNKYDGLYGGEKFRKYLTSKLTAKVVRIEDLKKPFAAIALNVIDGKGYMIQKGDIGYAMQASCAIPALRKPVEIDGMLFSDGGVICNLPVKQCRDLGADFVVAVNIDEPFERLPLKHFTRPGSMASRLLAWELFDIDQAQEGFADITVHPDTRGISLISTRKSDAARGLAAGEAAGRAALPELLRMLKKVGVVPTPTQPVSLVEKAP